MSLVERIRERAYFLWENRCGIDWRDPVANWVKAEEKQFLLEEALYVELDRRVGFIRDLFREAKVDLKLGSPLDSALVEARAIARAEKSDKPPTDENLHNSYSSLHVVYALAESLQTCVNAGVDVAGYLPQLTTGTTDFGVPAGPNDRTIFFKDFEFELLIAATLVKAGVIPTLMAVPNDPSGEMCVGNVHIEAKHPNTLGQLEKQMRKFNKELQRRGTWGMFAVALEDAFELGERADFESDLVYEQWLKAKRDGMEALGLRMIKRAAKLPRIAGLITTQTSVTNVAGATNLTRLANSVLFDHRESKPSYWADAEKVAKAFNPDPRLFSELNLADDTSSA